jgi:hypothetical protein
LPHLSPHPDPLPNGERGKNLKFLNSVLFSGQIGMAFEGKDCGHFFFSSPLGERIEVRGF